MNDVNGRPEERDDGYEQDTDVVTPLASDIVNSTNAVHNGLDSTVTSPTSSHKTQDPAHFEPLSGKSFSHSTTSNAGHSTYLSHEQANNLYFAGLPLRSSNSRRNLRGQNAGSTQSSSGSLQTLAEQEDASAPSSVRRVASTRSSHAPGHVRRHSKSASMSQPITAFQKMNNDQPSFPDQSFLSLSHQLHQSNRPRPVRARSSHPAQHSLYREAALSPRSAQQMAPHIPVSKTVDNTPVTSPGLFSPVPLHGSRPLPHDTDRSGSPSLHHLQAPKETHAAEIEHDTMTGNKIINSYEVLRELGRGEHGKVKLGRDMTNGSYVAIKIVPRYSKRRRLGDLGAPQDQTKREVAILKRARHPNVVSLLEVIDDPNKNKVYLVLEFVDHGEIKWRRPGVTSIAKINNVRFESERRGISLTPEPSEQDLWTVAQELRKHNMMRSHQNHTHAIPGVSHWQTEHDIDEEGSDYLERSVSRPRSLATPISRTHSADGSEHFGSYQLSGSMYGPYDDRPYRAERKQSIAASHMSSEVDLELGDDEQFSYVPALTQDEARKAFRDTLLGLEFLHAIGIIHRDIKPSNLLVGGTSAVKISDFGVSYFGHPVTDDEIERTKAVAADAAALDDERELARSVGTPAFWAPELCYEDTNIFEDNATPKITGALDLWALGITLYCMIYARLPFYVSDHMGLHEAACTTDVCCPKTRLVPADTTEERFVTSRDGVTINSNKRFDYELKFEIVPDTLRDLIKKLLIKDPAKRINIAQAKNHPWVTEQLEDVEEFLKPPEIENQTKKILDVPEKDISTAVVRRNLIARTWDASARILSTLVPGASKGRNRASSTATAASNSSESIHSPAGSTTSTVGKQDRYKEARRASVRGDELLHALQKSRENSEHPLAQSQTASPDNQEIPHYFAGSTPQQQISPRPSPRLGPYLEEERRPRLTERATSALSTADSVRTIRPTNYGNTPSMLYEPSGGFSLDSKDSSFKSRVEGLWEGTAKTLQRLASRDRRYPSKSRSPSASRRSSESENRALPSLAISNTQAAGSIEIPDCLYRADTPSSLVLTDDTPRPKEPHAQSSTASPISAFEQAQLINQRRHIQELTIDPAKSTEIIYEPENESCPPSPDDIKYLEQQQRVVNEDYGYQDATRRRMQAGPSASTIASSIDEFGESSVTQSLSNPSFVATSGTSSPPEGPWLSKEYDHLQQLADAEPESMKTTDTVVDHSHRQPVVATGKPLEREHEYYADDDDDDNDDDSEEDDGIMMGGLRKATI